MDLKCHILLLGTWRSCTHNSEGVNLTLRTFLIRNSSSNADPFAVKGLRQVRGISASDIVIQKPFNAEHFSGNNLFVHLLFFYARFL